jgi:hypothetical protein
MLRVEWLSGTRAPVASQIRAVRDVLRLQPWNAEAQGWLKNLERVAPRPAPAPAVLTGASENVVLSSC